MAQKIVISKSGFNVLTETDVNNLVFSSDYNTLKYYISGSITLALGSGTPTSAETTVNHNLGFYPFFMVYVLNGSRYYPLGVRVTGGGAFLYLSAYVSTTQLILRAERNTLAVGENWTFHYKLFRNNLNL